MKKLLFISMLFCAFPLMAQDGTNQGFTIDITTFTGIVALISLIVTQLAKYIKIVNENLFVKIGVSIVSGALISLLAWQLGVAEFLSGMTWWQAAIQGALAGLTASGAYDMLKGMFGKKEQEIEPRSGRVPEEYRKKP